MRAQLWEEEDSVQLYPGPTHGSIGEDEGRRHVLKFLWLKMLGFGNVLQSPWLSD